MGGAEGLRDWQKRRLERGKTICSRSADFVECGRAQAGCKDFVTIKCVVEILNSSKEVDFEVTREMPRGRTESPRQPGPVMPEMRRGSGVSKGAVAAGGRLEQYPKPVMYE